MSSEIYDKWSHYDDQEGYRKMKRKSKKVKNKDRKPKKQSDYRKKGKKY
tara:strand:+ start:483 stop:629 length:147 start_codon:yes stop_codon:yes gene_type:complete